MSSQSKCIADRSVLCAKVITEFYKFRCLYHSLNAFDLFYCTIQISKYVLRKMLKSLEDSYLNDILFFSEYVISLSHKLYPYKYYLTAPLIFYCGNYSFSCFLGPSRIPLRLSCGWPQTQRLQKQARNAWWVQSKGNIQSFRAWPQNYSCSGLCVRQETRIYRQSILQKASVI